MAGVTAFQRRTLALARTAYSLLPNTVRKSLRPFLAGSGMRFLVVGRAGPPPRSLWDRSQQEIVGPMQGPRVSSTICRHRDFDTPYFRDWVRRFAEPMRYHKPVWEWVYVAEMLRQSGMLAEGSKGLGCGVGRELLPAVFAAFGCEVTATDLPSHKSWFGAGSNADLKHPAICADEIEDRLVKFRAADMTDVPAELSGFDFCWSCSSLEHLGSITAGLEFIESSLNTLRPGGVAVRTTEFNVSSDGATVETVGVVVFRAQDLRRLADNLTRAGHQVAPFDLKPGDLVLDRFIDLPHNERNEPHLMYAIEGFTATAVGLLIRKSPAA